MCGANGAHPEEKESAGRLPSSNATRAMEPALRVALEAVHASPVRAVLHVTGGAAQSLGWVMAVPGASRTLLEARVPYAFARANGRPARPRAEAVRQPPDRARHGARGVQARRATHPPRSKRASRRRRRVHVRARLRAAEARRAQVRRRRLRCQRRRRYTLAMEKGRRDRWDEDGLASRLVVQALADAAADADADAASVDVAALGPVAPVEPPRPRGRSDVLGARRQPHDQREPIVDPIEWLTSGAGDLVELTDGVPTAIGAVPPNALVLPGSFNPTSRRHRPPVAPPPQAMLRTSVPVRTRVRTRGDQRRQGNASGRGGSPPRRAVHGCDVGLEDVECDRARWSPCQTRRHRCSDAVRNPRLSSRRNGIMPGATFVIGHDTAIRLVMPKYYGGEARMMPLRSSVRTAFVRRGGACVDDTAC